uniref:ATP synthase subunit a n=1 Tax=Phyllomimus sinicus TaxID=948398 RepID=A0A7L9QDS3_9ORTH|nr:ATP synthase F0 subunit 6 [Phyllomimus sinicus]
MMTMSLFSVFDPSASMISFPMNWISMLLGLLMIPLPYWFLPSRYSFLWNSINEKLHHELNLLLKKNKGATSIFIPLFLFIFFNNFLGLFPYIFTSTSHMSMTMSLAIPLWLSFMLYGWIKNTNHMFAHLMPQGTPPMLMVFMVCIETISNLIRPGTLAVRLAANMIAGHLLLTLLGNTGPYLTFLPMNLLILTQLALLFLETAVSIIQAYVFTLLLTLYVSDVN